MSETNPNTPVVDDLTTTESNATGGDSLDDAELENLFLNPEHRARSKKPEKKAEKEDTAPKAKDLGNPNVTDDEKPPKAEGKGSEKPGKEKDKDAAAKEEQAAKEKLAEQKAKKAFKGRAGDKELELDEDAEFTVKIDGQDVTVKASDLFGNYSGKVAWDKRFNELNLQKRAHLSETNKLNSVKGQIREIFSEKDPNLRLFKMAQLSGVSPVDFRKNFFDQMIPEVEKYIVMTDDERKARDLEFENSFLKYQADAAQKSLTDQQAVQELDKKVKTLTRQAGITTEQFHSTLEELVSSTDEKTRATLEREGKFAHGYPTPEFIVEIIQKESLWSAAESALEGVKTEWNPQEKSQKLFQLVEDAFRNGIKADDMAEVVSEIWGKARAKRIVERVERERQEHFEGKKPVNHGSFQGHGDAWSFDQL
jgi:hypothetical protein